MSEWLKLTNKIKRAHWDELLTPTQRDRLGCLQRELRYPNWVNLFGPAGSGKTFLMWVLSRANGMVYVTAPKDICGLNKLEAHEGVLIDNAPGNEDEARRVLARCNLIEARTVVLVTRSSVTMPMTRVELPLPLAAELRGVGRQLALLGYSCNWAKMPSSPSFWHVLQACV